jgi:hypothetical protein
VRSVSQHQTIQRPVEALSAVETEIYYLPEYFYWDLFTPTSVGCTYGGTFNRTKKVGTRHLFDFDHCELIANFKMTGDGSYHTENDRFVLDIKTAGRWTCYLKYVRTGERIKITGKCNGKPINADRDDDDREKHKMPNSNEPKEG